MVASLMLSGVSEGIGIVTVLPLLELISGGERAAHTGIGRSVSQGLAVLGLRPSLLTLLALIVIGMVLKGAFALLAMKEVGYTVAHVNTDFRLKLVRALLSVRWGYFVSQPAGYLANALSSETVRAAGVYYAVANLIVLGIQVVLYAVMAFLISWQIAIVGLAVGGILAFVFRNLIAAARRAGGRQTELLKSITVRLVDALQGIKPIKAMARETQILPLLEQEAQGLNAAQQQQIRATETLRVSQEPLLALVIAAGVYVAMTYADQSLAAILVMVFLFHRLVSRVHSIQQYYQTVVVGESAFWSLHESITRAQDEREQDLGRRIAPPVLSDIRFESVRFSHGDKVVLKNVSLQIPAGRFVAIIGPSGAGKTTIADLVLGLHRPESGAITIDGVDLAEFRLESWRHSIGYLPQETFLFNDSVRRNVTLGDEAVTDDDVRRALRAAGAWEFVSEFPQELDTMIGERGAKLSGGQRQRLSIARALVHKPQLLILDEVTTALDPITEAAICERLLALRGSVTILAISHQPKLTEVADLVYQLKDGMTRLVVPGRGEASVMPSPQYVK